LSALLDISYDEFDEDYESDDSSDLGSAKGTALISLKQTEFSLKQFAKTIGQPNLSTFNKWTNVWVAGLLQKKHSSIIRGPNRSNQFQDGPPHGEPRIADSLTYFETWLQRENFVMLDGFEDSGSRWF
jgi:hypothetical protein